MPVAELPKPTVTTSSTSPVNTTPVKPSHTQGSLCHGVAAAASDHRAARSQAKYSTVGNSSGTTRVRNSRGMAHSTVQPLGEVDEHPGGRAPDIAALIGEYEKHPRPPGRFALGAVVVLAVEN